MLHRINHSRGHPDTYTGPVAENDTLLIGLKHRNRGKRYIGWLRVTSFRVNEGDDFVFDAVGQGPIAGMK